MEDQSDQSGFGGRASSLAKRRQRSARWRGRVNHPAPCRQTGVCRQSPVALSLAAVDTRHMADSVDRAKAGAPWAILIGMAIAMWSMHDDVKKAQSAADEAESQVSALHAKVEELSDDIDECESKAKEADEKAEDLDSKVDDLESRVSDLE